MAELKYLDSFSVIEIARADGPVLVFKHSAVCGTSMFAREQVLAYLENGRYDVHMLVVQEQRPLSGEIADKLGIRHESPQVLVVTAAGTEALNHYAITAENIAAKAGA